METPLKTTPYRLMRIDPERAFYLMVQRNGGTSDNASGL